MCDVSDPALAEAYQEVRNDSNPTDWCVFGYEGNKIVLVGKGSGGFDEFAAQLTDNGCFYGFVRFTTGDEESKRAKFAFISWAGSGAPALKKAKMSVHKADVKTIIRDFAIETHITEREELDHDKIRATIIKAGGANYMGQS